MLAMDPCASMTVISAFGYVLSIPSVAVLMFITGLIISVRAQMTINTNYSWTLEISKIRSSHDHGTAGEVN